MADLFKRADSAYWYCTYQFNGTQVRVSTGTKSKAIAERFLAKKIEQLALGKVGAGNKPVTRKMFLASYESRALARGSAPRSVTNNVARLARFFDWVGKPPYAIETHHIEAYMVARAAVVSSSTVRRDLDPLFAAFKHAHKQRILLDDPCATVSKPPVERKLITHLRTHEVIKVLDAARQWRDGDLLLGVGLAAYAGLRLAEIQHTDWEDVDVAAQRLYVRGKDGWKPKTRQERALPMSDALAKLFAGGGSGPVLATARGKRRGKTYMTKGMVHIRAVSRVELAGWQVLRHTFASSLVSAGVSIYKVSKLLGHSTVTTTERHYAHLAPDELGHDVNLLGY